MDVIDAARRGAGVWERAWAAKDVEAIVALYADSVQYRALVLREPELGVAGVRAYLQRTFGEEDAIECHFGELEPAGPTRTTVRRLVTVTSATSHAPSFRSPRVHATSGDR